MIKQSFKYASPKLENIRYYLVSILFIFTVVGFPLVVGNYSKIITRNMIPNEKTKDDLPEYTPYIETYLDGLMTIGFSSIPILIPSTIYLTLPYIINAYPITNPITALVIILISLVLIITSLVCLYVFPYFSSVQAYRKYNMTRDDENEEFSIMKGFVSIVMQGDYNSIVKNFLILGIVVTIIIQLLNYNVIILIILGPPVFLFYINSISYFIGSYSDSVLKYKDIEQTELPK